ncbi:unnamed protein product, partial [Meganyctiphanes norvegica]
MFKIAQGISLHNIANVNMDVVVKYENEHIVKSDKNYDSQEILRKSAFGILEVKVKEDIEVKEKIHIQAEEINLINEIELYEEPIVFTEGICHLKHELIHMGEKSYQCSQCDKAFSNNSTHIQHHITHTELKPYQ